MVYVAIYRQYIQNDGIKREIELLLFRIIIAAAITPPKAPQIHVHASRRRCAAFTTGSTEKQQSHIQVKLPAHILYS